MKTRLPLASALIAAAALLAVAMLVESSNELPLTIREHSSSETIARRHGSRVSLEVNREIDRFIRLVEWNPDRAIREVMSLPMSTNRDEVLLCVAAEIVREDCSQAFDLGSSLPASPERDELLLRAIRELALADREAAIVRARSFVADDPLLLERLLAAVLVEWSETDSPAAASMAALELSEGKVQDDAVVSIVQRWYQKDPEAAVAWVMSFAPGELRSAAIAAIGSHLDQWSGLPMETVNPPSIEPDDF
jgi:hypothetical protein